MKIKKRLIDMAGPRDIVQRRIPFLSLDSGKPGPVVALTACIHGDEVGGTVIVHDIFKALLKKGLDAGAVHAMPLVNSLGFENMSRYVNSEREDLNRCFPGDRAGSMGEKMAHRLFDALMKTKPSLVIDLHNDWIHSVPYILIEPSGLYASQDIEKTTLDLARAAKLPLVEDTDDNPEMQKTLAAAMVGAGIPAFTIEAGGAYTVVEEIVAAGVTAVLAVLGRLGMCEALDTHNYNAGGDALLRYTNRPLCTSSGLVRFAVEPGDQVKAGQTLARVYNAFGSCEETLKATGPGYVLGLPDHARVLPGSEVIAIAELPA